MVSTMNPILKTIALVSGWISILVIGSVLNLLAVTYLPSTILTIVTIILASLTICGAFLWSIFIEFYTKE